MQSLKRILINSSLFISKLPTQILIDCHVRCMTLERHSVFYRIKWYSSDSKMNVNNLKAHTKLLWVGVVNRASANLPPSVSEVGIPCERMRTSLFLLRAYASRIPSICSCNVSTLFVRTSKSIC